MSPFVADPHYLPYRLDPIARRVLWLRLDAAHRRDAAFLDERAIPPRPDGAWAPLASLLDLPPPSAPAHAVFHIGHCGSTLLSRLLESWPQVQALREPLPLRTLAELWPGREQPCARFSAQESEHVLRALWQRWSQPLAPATRTLVKATSSCNGLIEPLLGAQPRLRAVLLDLPLRPYLATLFKSEGSTFDAASAAGERLLALQAAGFAGDLALHRLSLPQQCAMGWLAEQVRFDRLARGTHAARVLRLDFEALLATPEAALHAVARHFELDAAGVAAAVAAPAWQRYSKAPQHGYGRDDRAHDLALAAQRFGAALEEGEAWIAARLAAEPGLGRIVAGRCPPSAGA